MGKQEQERQRGKRREGRHEERRALHERGGGRDTLKLPEGLALFKPEVGKYHIDIIPSITGKYNKVGREGDEYFELTYPAYKNLGVEEKSYVAIGELLGQKDPVAEHFAALRKTDKDWKTEIKPFQAIKRQLFLVFVHEQADKGLQLYEASWFTFGKLLDEEIADNQETWVDNFDDPDGGATLLVRFAEEKVGNGTWIKATKINFTEREGGFDAGGDAKLAKKILAHGIVLDDLLKIPTYDQLKKALDGEPDKGDDDEDDRPAKSSKKPAADEDDDDKPKKKTPPPDDDDEPEEEDEEPAKKSKKPDPDEDEDGEEEPAPKKKKKFTAEDLGIEKGGEVDHDEHGRCTVIRITSDGNLVLSDKDDETHKNIDPTDVEPVVERAAEKKSKKPDEDDEDEDEAPAKKAKGEPDPDEDEDDEESASGAGKKGATGKSASPSKSKKDDEDWDEDWDDEDPKPAKKKKKDEDED